MSRSREAMTMDIDTASLVSVAVTILMGWIVDSHGHQLIGNPDHDGEHLLDL